MQQNGTPTYTPRTARKAEGDAGIACRDATWDHVDQVLADVVSKVRLAPSVSELLSELPIIVWPE